MGRRPAFGFRLLIASAIVAILSSSADARQRHRVSDAGNRTSASREDYTPPTASIVIDGNSGAVLEASNSKVRCHPASLTKIMTLYLLFEHLEANEVHLDSLLKVSEHASEQAPSKLGLKPGQTITVEDAIKGIVTKSANDAAVVVAESLGHTEENFAKLMTQQAHTLGMTGTTYVNASGLPDDGQVTTASDQALLGRAIQERFPRYYKYFSTEAFVYHGETMRNHNHLLGAVEGMDGIKTGYTRASGFNLVASVQRDGRHIVAVVLGGKSSFERDVHMRKLISAHIQDAAVRPTTPVHPQSLATASEKLRADFANPVLPAVAGTNTVQTPQQQEKMSDVSPASAPIASSDASEPSAQIAARWPSTAEAFTPIVTIPMQEALAETTPELSERVQVEPRQVEPESRSRPKTWSIQIGAFDKKDDAKRHLAAARHKVRAILASAESVNEHVKKAKNAVYRARFVGLDKASADSACKQLRRSEIECIALEN
jgi:D-alanyl-D-alanine carboxypeptidase